MKMSKKGGFSLVELAIVLAIMSILTIVAISGRSMLNSAKVAGITQELRSYEIANEVFKNNYNCIAGDCRVASTLFVGANVTNVRNGNGNGEVSWSPSPAAISVIAGNPLIGQTPAQIIATTQNETLEVNRHLFLAGIFNQDKPGCGYAAGDITAAGLTIAPADELDALTCEMTAATANISKLEGSFISTTYVSATGIQANVLMLGKVTTTANDPQFGLNSTGFNASDVSSILRAVDTKNDDGEGGKGSIRVVSSTSPTTSAVLTGTLTYANFSTGADHGILIKLI